MLEAQRQKAELARLVRFKRTPPAPAQSLGQEALAFFRQSVQKRQSKLTKIVEHWEVLIPAGLAEHCALEGLSRGTLTVLVDSSAHLYELKQLLLSGVEKQLTAACKSTGLRKIALKAGRFGDSSTPASR